MAFAAPAAETEKLVPPPDAREADSLLSCSYFITMVEHQPPVSVSTLSGHTAGRLFPLAEVNLTGRVLLTQFVVGSLARSLFHQQVRLLCEGNG